MAAISLRNIRKSFGTVPVVHDFSLEIADKEFIVLVGPSGCGKSTTLRMIAGLEEITAGELRIGDVVVNDLESKDRDIAMVFQNYALYPHMTVYKNMAFGLLLRKAPKGEIDAKVREAARVLAIEHLLNRKPKQLSGGQRQRVALGRAMVRNPAVFLLDEPLSNLDAKLRATMRVEIAKLHKRLGTTMIYVTHDQIEAMTMANRIVVMRDGFIQQVDTPQHLYDNPCNMFVAGFIGSPQMNMLPVRVERAGAGFVARFGDHLIPLPERADETVLAPWVGRDCMLGVRPEDLYDAALQLAGAPVLALLPALVELAEPMGSEVHLNLIIDETRLIARVPPRSGARENEIVTIGIDTTKLHLFDRETERTIFN